jgi:hypothetical protein
LRVELRLRGRGVVRRSGAELRLRGSRAELRLSGPRAELRLRSILRL